MMILGLTADQDFLRETTAKFLANQAPVDEVRRLRDDPAGFQADYWRRGADLGWTSLVVAEKHGGGSVSGQGLIDLTLIAHEFGRHAAPGPLVPTNIVAAALSNSIEGNSIEGGSATEGASSGDCREVLSGLLSGASTAAWCFEEQHHGGDFASVGLDMRVDGGDVVLNGTKRPVEAAAQADHLLVTGRTDDGLTQVLVPAGTPGLSVAPMHSVDLTRRFHVVSFEDVRLPLDAVIGEIGDAAEQVERQLQIALVMLNAESVGAMERAFDMTVEWAFDRYTFGRPLASYQELKHRFADMKSWLEAGHAVSDAAAAAAEAGDGDAPELVSIAKAFIGQYGGDLVQDCVQIHGGIGVTFDHDLHLFLRRVTVDRNILGTPAEHRQRIATITLQQEDRA